jgi:hypothetical protein
MEKRVDYGQVTQVFFTYLGILSNALHFSYREGRLFVLVKWWRTDNRGGRSNWVDITGVRVFEASGPDPDIVLKRRRIPKAPSPTPAASADSLDLNIEVCDPRNIVTEVMAEDTSPSGVPVPAVSDGSDIYYFCSVWRC